MSLLAKAIALGATLILQSAIAADRPEFKSDKDKTSYAIGLDVARNFRKNGIEFDPAWFSWD